MPRPSRNPNNAWVRTQVPRRVHDNARIAAREVGVTIWTFYTYVLSRELYNIDPVGYGRKLKAQMFTDMEDLDRATIEKQRKYSKHSV